MVALNNKADDNKTMMSIIITPKKVSKFIADSLLRKTFTALLKLIKILPYVVYIKIVAQLNVRRKRPC